MATRLPDVKLKLEATLEARGITRSRFAKHFLEEHPNRMTIVRKPGYDPKLSTLVRWATLLQCDVNELFESRAYDRARSSDRKDRAKRSRGSRKNDPCSST